LSLGGTGEQVSDWGNKTANFTQALPEAGWVMDPHFSGGGAAGDLITIRKGDYACRYISAVEPESPSLCSDDEALVACLARLEPKYIQYDITVGCTPDSYVPPEVDPGPVEDPAAADRISFDPGSIRAFVGGKLGTSTSQRYVLFAQEGQEMVVSLQTNPPLNGIIVVYGADGTVLISDHASTAFWYGYLPSTQDYFISVSSSPDYPIAYNMQVTIPPLGDSYTDGFSPIDAAACQGISDLIGASMGIQPQTRFALFSNFAAGLGGVGCQVTAWDTSDIFPDWHATGTAVLNTLIANGWTEDPQYAADGVGGTGTGLTKGDNLCYLTYGTRELDPWVCESYEGPIGICWNDLTPEEMYTKVEINCAVQN
jgi:hypothetical protein